MNIRAWAWWICSSVVSVLCVSAASAQAPLNYPAKTVRVVVGFAPRGGVDVIARFFSQKLSESLGQSFIVENRPGHYRSARGPSSAARPR